MEEITLQTEEVLQNENVETPVLTKEELRLEKKKLRKEKK